MGLIRGFVLRARGGISFLVLLQVAWLGHCSGVILAEEDRTLMSVRDVSVERGHLKFRLVNLGDRKIVVNPILTWSAFGTLDEVKPAGVVATTQPSRVSVETAPQLLVSVVRDHGSQVPPFLRTDQSKRGLRTIEPGTSLEFDFLTPAWLDTAESFRIAVIGSPNQVYAVTEMLELSGGPPTSRPAK